MQAHSTIYIPVKTGEKRASLYLLFTKEGKHFHLFVPRLKDHQHWREGMITEIQRGHEIASEIVPPCKISPLYFNNVKGYFLHPLNRNDG